MFHILYVLLNGMCKKYYIDENINLLNKSLVSSDLLCFVVACCFSIHFVIIFTENTV